MTTKETPPEKLSKVALLTPLYKLHRAAEARMGLFAGYEMPFHYPAGTIKEHLHTRSAAGLFDVSHMGQLAVCPRKGNITDTAIALETLMPVDLVNLPVGRQRYAFFTNGQGGILDDLIIANYGDHFFLVVNASRVSEDMAHLRARLSDECMIERLDHRALLALQGPTVESVIERIIDGASSMHFMDVREVSIFGKSCLVSRSGYTGEDGFEISMPADIALQIAANLLDDKTVALIGLAARNSLRLEAGLSLYGLDLDASTSPVEAGLAWAIQKCRRAGGSRGGNFLGADVILRQLSDGPPRRRVGLRPEGRAPIRTGTKLFSNERDETAVGFVTSGSFSPTIDAPIAMGYLNTEHAMRGSILFAELRGKRVPVHLTTFPFVRPNYKRD